MNIFHVYLDQKNAVGTLSSPPTNAITFNSQMNAIHVTNVCDNEPIPQKAFLNTLSDATIEKILANSFSNWPLITPSAKDMATAGWAYTNIADRVICVHCDALYHKWTESDRPYQIHQLKSPQCPFILASEKKKTSVSNIANATITTAPDTQVVAGAANSNYSQSYRRHESFQNWPHTEENPLPPIESFVDAGFYYTGDGKIVRCFYCDGALRNWENGDDPKVEHARWFPHCAYIRQYIGEDLYQAIQRKNRELKGMQRKHRSRKINIYFRLAQQASQQNAKDSNSVIISWSHDEIDRMVKARLDLPVVEKLRQEGYSMAIIR